MLNRIYQYSQIFFYKISYKYKLCIYLSKVSVEYIVIVYDLCS